MTEMATIFLKSVEKEVTDNIARTLNLLTTHEHKFRQEAKVTLSELVEKNFRKLKNDSKNFQQAIQEVF